MKRNRSDAGAGGLGDQLYHFGAAAVAHNGDVVLFARLFGGLGRADGTLVVDSSDEYLFCGAFLKEVLDGSS
jgi:hypothetical protein